MLKNVRVQKLRFPGRDPGSGRYREVREAHLRELPSPARLSRSIARERHREGSPYARLTPPRARSRRASLAIISATGGLLAAVPCVLFSLLHIFPTQNCHFWPKSPNLASKRNAKRPFWRQTYIFPMKYQYF